MLLRSPSALRSQSWQETVVQESCKEKRIEQARAMKGWRTLLLHRSQGNMQMIKSVTILKCLACNGDNFNPAIKHSAPCWPSVKCGNLVAYLAPSHKATFFLSAPLSLSLLLLLLSLHLIHPDTVCVCFSGATNLLSAASHRQTRDADVWSVKDKLVLKTSPLAVTWCWAGNQSHLVLWPCLLGALCLSLLQVVQTKIFTFMSEVNIALL